MYQRRGKSLRDECALVRKMFTWPGNVSGDILDWAAGLCGRYRLLDVPKVFTRACYRALLARLGANLNVVLRASHLLMKQRTPNFFAAFLSRSHWPSPHKKKKRGVVHCHLTPVVVCPFSVWSRPASEERFSYSARPCGSGGLVCFAYRIGYERASPSSSGCFLMGGRLVVDFGQGAYLAIVAIPYSEIVSDNDW